MPNADSHCQNIQVHCTVLSLKEFFSRGNTGNIQQVSHLYIHTESYFPVPRNGLSPVPCESLWTSFLYLDMGWREAWNQRNVELCPPSQKTSHCTRQEENSTYLQSLLCTDTSTQKNYLLHLPVLWLDSAVSRGRTYSALPHKQIQPKITKAFLWGK